MTFPFPTTRHLGPATLRVVLGLVLLSSIAACSGPVTASVAAPLADQPDAVATADASELAAAPRLVHPMRERDGRIARDARGQVMSTNWSGYVVSRPLTHQAYTQASGSWIVPRVTSPAGRRGGASATWVGIGGYCLDAACRHADRSLIQLGTEQDAAASGAARYSAWYELLPAASVPIDLAIHPGDAVVAHLQLLGSTRFPSDAPTWVLSMTNQTTGQSWSKTVVYHSSLASAEWIEEAPVARAILPLASFGTVTFDALRVNGGQNPRLLPGEAIHLADPSGQTANPSVPNAAANGFNVCSGPGHALTPCSPPA